MNRQYGDEFLKDLLLEEPDPSVHLHKAVKDSPCHKAAKDLSAHLRKVVAGISVHPQWAAEVFPDPIGEVACPDPMGEVAEFFRVPSGRRRWRG